MPTIIRVLSGIVLRIGRNYVKHDHELTTRHRRGSLDAGKRLWKRIRDRVVVPHRLQIRSSDFPVVNPTCMNSQVKCRYLYQVNLGRVLALRPTDLLA